MKMYCNSGLRRVPGAKNNPGNNYILFIKLPSKVIR